MFWKLLNSTNPTVSLEMIKNDPTFQQSSQNSSPSYIFYLKSTKKINGILQNLTLLKNRFKQNKITRHKLNPTTYTNRKKKMSPSSPEFLRFPIISRTRARRFSLKRCASTRRTSRPGFLASSDILSPRSSRDVRHLAPGSINPTHSSKRERESRPRYANYLRVMLPMVSEGYTASSCYYSTILRLRTRARFAFHRARARVP